MKKLICIFSKSSTKKYKKNKEYYVFMYIISLKKLHPKVF